MLIDFHTHVFPQKIASKTITMLCNNMSKNCIPDLSPTYDGTVEGLRRHMSKCGVSISVVMPIATKPSQFKSINDYAEYISNDGIISFGSVHPYQEAPNKCIDELKERGFIGIKLHPDYQDVYADDEKMISLVRYATECGLYVTMHSGEDAGVIPPYKSTMRHMVQLLNNVDASHVILAHMGAFNEWDAVESKLCNTQAYFDISMVSRFMDADQYTRIILKHGADKMLFGSDGPWESPTDTLNMLCSVGLSPSDIDKITYSNAKNILNSNFFKNSQKKY